MTRPLRIGLIGASNLAITSIIEPARKIGDVEITMVAAREISRANDYAAANNINSVAANYQELIKSGGVDLVYICLPNVLHEEWGTLALENKLHVLLEKPAAPDEAAAMRLLAAASKNNCRLIEAFHYHYHPLFTAIKQIVLDGNLGTIKSFNAKLDVPMPPSENAARWDKELGGGVMLDIGCYPVHWARHLVGEFEPIETITKFAETGVDEAVVAHVKFGNGAIGTIDVSMTPHNGQRYSRLKLEMTNGAIEVRNLVLPHYGHDFNWRIGDEWHHKEFKGGTTYFYQLQAIKEAIKSGGKLPTEGDDILKNAQSIMAILNKQVG